MAKNKISRKELLKESDEFITFTGRMINLLMAYRIQVGTAVGVVLGLILIVTLINYLSNQSEYKAFANLEEARSAYNELVKTKTPQEAYQETAKSFETLLDKKPDTNAGRIGKVIFGNICYRAGEYDKAIKLYEEALEAFETNPTYKFIILSGLGYAYEEKKDYAAAVKYFEMIASGSESTLQDEALFNLGRLYTVMGEKEKSMKAYQKVVSDHTDSIYLELVKAKIAG